MHVLAILALLFIVIIYSAFSWGYVAHTMYTWFVLPYFPDLPTFTTIHFIGFMLFASVFTNRSNTHIKDEFKDQNAMYTSLFLSPWLALFVAWFLKALLM